MKDPVFSRGWRRYHFFKLLSKFIPSGNKNSEIPESPSRILVLAPVHRGDYLIMSPLLYGLHQARPKAEIAVLTSTDSLELALVDPNVDHVIYYRKDSGIFRSLKEIHDYKPDIVIYPKGHPSFTECMLMFLSGARHRIGLSHPHHDVLLTCPVQHDWENEHRSITLIRLLTPFGTDINTVSRRLHLGTTKEVEEWADNAIKVIPEGSPLIAINISALSKNRIWVEEKWSSLIKDLSFVQPGVQFLVLGLPVDSTICKNLVANHPNVSTIKTPGMLEATALIARCDLLVTVDTGIVQSSAAKGVPMLVLYNGDHEVYTRFGPQSVGHRPVFAKRGNPVSSIETKNVFHELVHLLVQINWKIIKD